MSEPKVKLDLILNGCMQGNRLSQRKLYEHFFSYAMNISLRYARNTKEAEEILNDGFLRIFSNLDKYDPKYPFKGWLRKVLIHVAVDYYRKYKTYNKMTVNQLRPDIIEDDQPFAVVSPEEDVLPILKKLSPAYRMVFNLYVMEEYKHAEIAELLNISINTSKSNLSRAKMILRALWQENNARNTKLNEHG